MHLFSEHHIRAQQLHLFDTHTRKLLLDASEIWMTPHSPFLNIPVNQSCRHSIVAVVDVYYISLNHRLLSLYTIPLIPINPNNNICHNERRSNRN